MGACGSSTSERHSQQNRGEDETTRPRQVGTTSEQLAYWARIRHKRLTMLSPLTNRVPSASVWRLIGHYCMLLSHGADARMWPVMNQDLTATRLRVLACILASPTNIPEVVLSTTFSLNIRLAQLLLRGVEADSANYMANKSPLNRASYHPGTPTPMGG